ncbi:hypothetical protein [Humibacter sp. RRB41]|uniref:hypothetical protein n=1 Tax=Humibacter sp. RRB41 TaxID=2919946 RepID=UPI001FAA644A|nr:hypothetical protein [Humibacter sp. RRB41]
MTTTALTPAMRWTTIVSVWVVTLIASVLVGVFAVEKVSLGWLGITMAGSILVAMCVQLATQEKQGFVIRFGTSVAGSFVILVLATGVLFLVHA